MDETDTEQSTVTHLTGVDGCSTAWDLRYSKLLDLQVNSPFLISPHKPVSRLSDPMPRINSGLESTPHARLLVAWSSLSDKMPTMP